MKLKISFFIILFLSSAVFAQKKRPLKPADIYRLKNISDPRLSPEGNWIAYVLSSIDSAKDIRISNLWMTSWDGQHHIQLTHTKEETNAPRWSPDGKYLSFLSDRTNLKHPQIWLLDRRGGEAKKITDIPGDITEYEWSPDSKKILLVIRDLERPDSLKEKTKTPIVIDRVHFKQDVEGYRLPLFKHLYQYTIDSNHLDTLTTGPYLDFSPAWSPDGNHIVFVSNRSADPDRNDNTDLWLVKAKKGNNAIRLTSWPGSDENPVWSPDGKFIAYLKSTGDEKFVMYDQPILTIIPANGGEPKSLTNSLDRPVSNPVWSPDSKHIAFIVSDDRKEYLGQVNIENPAPSKINDGNHSFSRLAPHPSGNWLAMMSSPQMPSEIFAVENGDLRRITKHHEDFVAPLLLAEIEGFTSKSKDGTMVSNILFLPPGNTNKKNLPTIFFIHGGPVDQDSYDFDLSRQMLAAGGYAVVAVNYRGSSGRGLAFTKAIYSDWGNKEVMDIFGAIDYLVKEGISDGNNLAIGGWSYGGILTDYCIASDPLRFKAAASGAGSALQLSLFGVDQYITQFENEIGYPWKNIDKYLKLSYPFLKADKIKTPTLFLTGEKDFNVPAIGSEQMYQALKVQGIPTQLIIYPGQYHLLTTPSYQIDRFHRYLNWFNKYLNSIMPVKVKTR